MTIQQSYPFDLITTPLFIDKFNVSYSKSDFDKTNKFQFVVSTICPNNLEDCLNTTNGGLLGTVNNVVSADVALEWYEQDEHNIYIRIANTVTINLPNDIDVKGIFLRKKADPKFVLFGMVNQTPLRFCSKMIFEKDNILLQITK